MQGSISIPDIDDSLNLVFLWCTIALYGNYKEDYYWENFKQQVFRKNAVEDFLQRLLYKKASKMTRDQSFIAAEILNKQEEFLAKQYLKKKQKVQLEKLFLFIKNVNECWTISQEIRIKVLYFDQVQKEFLELEVMKAEHEAEQQIYQEKLKQFELTMESLNETRSFLEKQLTEMVELQQNGEQYLLYLNEAQKKYFPYYDKMTIAQRQIQIEDMVYGRVTDQQSQGFHGQSSNSIPVHLNLRDSQILLMNQQDINSVDGQTIPTFRSTHHITQKIQAINLDLNRNDVLSIGESEVKEGETVRNLKQFQNFDAEAELDKSQNSMNDDRDDDENDKKDEEKEDACNIF